MFELKLGFVSTQELAEWSSRTVNYLEKNKKKWCNDNLGSYADFKLVRGGVEILKIYDPIFASPVKKQVEENFDKCWGIEGFKADTCREASIKIAETIKHNTVQQNTIYNYTCATKRERYGLHYASKRREGTRGYSTYVFCKIVNGQFQPFTEEEENIKKQLMTQYLTSREEQVLQMRAAKTSLKRNEITFEEYQEIIAGLIDSDIGWDIFVERFEEAIGARTDFAILLEECAWNNVEAGEFDW